MDRIAAGKHIKGICVVEIERAKGRDRTKKGWAEEIREVTGRTKRLKFP